MTARPTSAVHMEPPSPATRLRPIRIAVPRDSRAMHRNCSPPVLEKIYLPVDPGVERHQGLGLSEKPLDPLWQDRHRTSLLVALPALARRDMRIISEHRYVGTARRNHGLSLPPIAVFKPHDVVLAQVAPRLDFYEEKRDLPHVFESMLGLDRDMGGLVFGQKLYLVASCHPRGARHHHPVLRPVVMHLQRERFARFDHDALDLKALACIDALVVAPGAIDPAV